MSNTNEMQKKQRKVILVEHDYFGSYGSISFISEVPEEVLTAWRAHKINLARMQLEDFRGSDWFVVKLFQGLRRVIAKRG